MGIRSKKSRNKHKNMFVIFRGCKAPKKKVNKKPITSVLVTIKLLRNEEQNSKMTLCKLNEVLREVELEIIDIFENEKFKGHTVEEHVSKSLSYLIRRANQGSKNSAYSIKRANQGPTNATSYYDKMTAIRATLENIRGNIREITKWVNDPKVKVGMSMSFTFEHKRQLGFGVYKHSKNVKCGIRISEIWLKKTNCSLGFILSTSYPKLP